VTYEPKLSSEKPRARPLRGETGAARSACAAETASSPSKSDFADKYADKFSEDSARSSALRAPSGRAAALL
jgi:hypothetical protein